MLQQRDRRPVPARARAVALPIPAPLPSLSGALARRAAIFGPYDGDEAPAAPRSPWQALGTAARRVVEALDLRRAS